jgi:sec-independent protein translocase protein TatA
MGALGMPEILVIAGVVLLIFGPKQIPRLGRALGDTIREMRGIGKELTGDAEKDEDR